MTRHALDYTGRIPGAVLRQLGYLDVFRYLGDPNVWPKAMTQSEVNDLRANGIRIHLNYEQTADFMLGGYAKGQSFAREARRWASLLGFSSNEPIIYSADIQLTPGERDLALDFLTGAANADGGRSNVGVYGQYDLLKRAIDVGHIGWQTNATAWSNGQVESRAIAWQHGQINVHGIDCDLNEMNEGLIHGGNAMSGQIPQSIRDKWPSIAGQFTGTYDDSSAIIWADAGARYAAQGVDDIKSMLRTGGSGLTLSGADIDAIAEAVARKLGAKLGA